VVGQTILHYEILEKLGAGGMGEVFKAQDKKLNRMVAIKVLSGESSEMPEYRRRFIQEAQAASSLNHPNIITIHDIFSHASGQFMVMEFVNGMTLADLIPPGGLNGTVAVQYAVQIADGLRAAHGPGNIMVTDRGLVKILDFGLAKVIGPAEEISLSDVTRSAGPAPMTVEGAILGTFAYMSPEQAQGARLDARTDVFSLGCVLYEMITGRKAFDGQTPLLTLTAILRDEPKGISQILPGVPPELEEIVRRALRKEPGQRFQSMEEMHRELAALKQRLESGARSTPRSPRRLGWAIAAVLVVMVGLAWVWWWVARGHATPPAAARTAAQAPNAAPKPSALSPPTLNNQAILDMAANHVPESVIIGQIRSSPTNFNLTTPEIIRLTQGGVSAAVMQAMRNPHAAETPAAQDRTVQLTGGLPFEIALREDVPADCKAGQALSFQVTTDVVVDGVVAIQKGAAVSGAIVDAGKRKFLVHTARPTFRLLEATAVNGTKVKIRATPGRLGESRKAPALDPLGGVRSKDAVAPAGSRFMAYVDGVQTLTVAK
jgi:serine/threonine-protein kinase